MKAWLATGGISKQVAMGAPPTLPRPQAPSDRESEVRASNEELPSPQQVVSKLQQSDDVEHTLDKGV